MAWHDEVSGTDLHYPRGAMGAVRANLALDLEDNLASAYRITNAAGTNNLFEIDTTTSALKYLFGYNTAALEFGIGGQSVIVNDFQTTGINDAAFAARRTAASYRSIVWDESVDEWVFAEMTSAPINTTDFAFSGYSIVRADAFKANGQVFINDDAVVGSSSSGTLTMKGASATELYLTTLSVASQSYTIIQRRGPTGTDASQLDFILGEAGSIVSRNTGILMNAGDGVNVTSGACYLEADGSLTLSAYIASTPTFIGLDASGLVFRNEAGSDLTTLTNEGALYTKDVTGTTHLFYRANSNGTVYQLTPGGGGGGGNLNDAYHYGASGTGRTITADEDAVVITDLTVGRTAYLLEIENGAAAFTGTPHGILIDFATATSITNAGDVYGVRLLGKTNAGAGSSIGISLDSAWDYAIRSGASIALDEISADPTAIANAGLLYVKDASAYAELFYRADNSAAVLQLTRQGYLNATALGIALQTIGDILYASSATVWSRLAAGTATYVLTANGAGVAPTWQASAAGVTDHGALTGLGDDDHTQYALLVGRAGGQILIGGTASGDDLTFESTSNATKGSVFFRDTDIQLNSNAAAGTDEDVLLTLLGGDGTTNLWRSIFYHDGGLGISGVYQNVNAADRSNGTQFHIDRADVVTSRGAGIVFNAGTGAASISGSITLEASGIVNILGSTGGMLIRGGTASGNDITFETTSHATKGTFIWSGACDWSVGGGVGTAAQVLTSNGAGAAPTWQAAAGGGGNLNDAYHYGASGTGRTITADEDAVVITDGTVGSTTYLFQITRPAGAYTGTPHGILVDFSAATSFTSASDIYGIRLIGETNAGAGASVGVSIDGGFDVGLEVTVGNHALKLPDGFVSGSVTGLTAVTGTVALITGTFAGTYAPGNGSVHIGDDLGNAGVTAQGTGCIVIGSQGAYARQAANYAVVLGYTANAASSSIAIGHLAVASATESIAIGNSTPTAAGARSIAIGRGANVGSSGTESMAFGYGTSTNNANCIVMGRGATSTAANQFVLGADGYAISQVFIGEGVTAATVPANISINPTGASGTDTAGNCVFYINGARGTGTGAGGDIVFQTAPPGTTGSTPGTLTERLRIQDTGEIQFTGNDIDLNSDATTASESCTLHLRAGNGTIIRDWRMFMANSATSILQLQKFDDGVLSNAHNLALGDSTSTAVFTSSLLLYASNGTNRSISIETNSAASLTISSSSTTTTGLKVFFNSVAAAGDVMFAFTGDVNSSYMGIDDSDADKLKLGVGTTMGTNTFLTFKTGATDYGAAQFDIPDNTTAASVINAGPGSFTWNTVNGSESWSFALDSNMVWSVNAIDSFTLQTVPFARERTRTGRVTTTDATQTTLITHTTDPNTAGWVEAFVSARNGSDSATYYRLYRWENISGTVTVTAMTTGVVDSEDAGLATADITVDASTTAFRIRVTGIAATTINWSGVIKFLGES